MAKSNLEDVDLKALTLLRQYPYGYKTVKDIVILFIIILLTALCILGIYEIYFYFDGIDALANILFMETAFCQFSAKMITYRYYIATFQNVLNIIEHDFWPTDKFGDEVKGQQDIMRGRAALGIRIYRNIVIISLPIFFFVRPLIQTKRQVPFPIDKAIDLNNNALYIILYVIETITSFYGVLLQVGVDTVFICLIMLSINQLNLLKYAFKTLNMSEINSDADEEKCYGKIKVYVAHHNMLLDFMGEIKRILSILLLVQLMSTVLALCGTLYPMTVQVEKTDYARTVQYVMCVGCFITQLALYCIAGHVITDASIEVGDAMFESDWWVQNFPRIRQATQMVMLRSQRPQKLTAGGIVDLNFETFATILKTSFSFLTLLKSVTGGDSN